MARFVEAAASAALNLLLAFAAYALVPEHSVGTTDRAGYEWIAQHGLARLGGTRSAVLSRLMAQMSFGFTFALFDPYTPDSAVLLAAALLVWA